MSKFNKKSLGPTILNLTKGANEELTEKNYELNEFATIINLETEETMIAFTVKQIPDKYFWASTGLYSFLIDNTEVGIYDEDRLSYTFDETVKITYEGKRNLKSDKTKQCNIWKINF